MQNKKIIKNFTFFFFFSLAVLGNINVFSAEDDNGMPRDYVRRARGEERPVVYNIVNLGGQQQRNRDPSESFAVNFIMSGRTVAEQSPEIIGTNFLIGAAQAAGQLAVIKVAENVGDWWQDPTEKTLLKNEKKQEQIERVNGQLVYLMNQKHNVSHLLELYEEDPIIAKSLQKQLVILTQKERCFILKLEELYTEWTDMKVSTKPPTKETDIQKKVILISDKSNPLKFLETIKPKEFEELNFKEEVAG